MENEQEEPIKKIAGNFTATVFEMVVIDTNVSEFLDVLRQLGLMFKMGARDINESADVLKYDISVPAEHAGYFLEKIAPFGGVKRYGHVELPCPLPESQAEGVEVFGMKGSRCERCSDNPRVISGRMPHEPEKQITA